MASTVSEGESQVEVGPAHGAGGSLSARPQRIPLSTTPDGHSPTLLMYWTGLDHCPLECLKPVKRISSWGNANAISSGSSRRELVI